MRSHFALLRFVARAAGNAVGFGVAGDFAVDFLPDLAQDVWAWWKGTTSEEQRKAEIEALSQTGTEEMLKEAGEIVQAELADKTPETRQAVATYLAQVPNSIRRSLRRPSDPTGMTMPGGLQLRKAEDLLQLLPSKPPRFKPGDRPLHGVDWELEQLLGVGGFGEVWKARNPHMTSAPPVALKFCLDAAAAKMLRNEASVLDRVMSQGKHSGIVQLRQTYLSADTPCLEYEYVAGGDLLGLVHDMQQPAGKLGWKQATQIIGRLAEIVGFAHRLSRPIVHRDLKPANILVYLKDGKAHLKIADFGIGAVAASQAIQKTLREASHGASMMRTLLGSYTPLYASPQQKRGEPPDPRDDVFALGVIWYQLLRGNMVAGPPSGMGWQKRLSEQGVPGEIVELLSRSFEEETEDRIADAAVLAEALSNFMTSEPAQPAVLATAPPPVPGRATAPARGLPTGPGQAITNSVGIKLAYIPPGEFMMGSPSSESGRFDDELQHRVRLTRPFYIGITPVTQQQWEAVMGSTPSSFNGGDRPVEQVSWDDAVNFCKRLSKKEGKRYRLPTEAEWEYACRAGTTGPYGGTGRLEDMGWFADNSGDARLDSAQIWTTDRANYIKRLEDNHCRTHSVGQKYANGWGLYDMHGNVWEWCDDWYGDYSAGAANDPKGLPTGWDRVLRGGSWYRDPQLCRSACRFRDTPDVRDVCIIGFRLALDFP